MSIRTAVAVGFVAFSAAACSASADGSDRPASAVPAHVRVGAVPRLVFFMNPDGVPCQIQDRVLRDMATELSTRAELVYYRTTDRGDLAQFGRYGIRALPMLLLTDPAGREIRRATPGIQTPEQIRRLIAP